MAGHKTRHGRYKIFPQLLCGAWARMLAYESQTDNGPMVQIGVDAGATE